jgi:hypothetical protein
MKTSQELKSRLCKLYDDIIEKEKRTWGIIFYPKDAPDLPFIVISDPENLENHCKEKKEVEELQ